MAEITAAAVKALRDKTQLPMMECKQALEQAGGDEEAAIRALREKGKKTMAGRADRTTEEGRVAIYASLDPGVGAMIELLCESPQVAKLDDFGTLCNDLVQQLATGPGANSAEELLSQESPSTGKPIQEQWDDFQNRSREVLRLTRMVRFDAPCGGYVHHDFAVGVLLEVEGKNADLAKDISMHIAAMRPKVVSKDELDPADVQREREILSAAAREEGQPENIIEKMVEGRMRNYYAEYVLEEQPFVKDDKQTVGKVAQAGGLTLKRFVHWQLGKGQEQA
jgi:elongation factor Ts